MSTGLLFIHLPPIAIGITICPVTAVSFLSALVPRAEQGVLIKNRKLIQFIQLHSEFLNFTLIYFLSKRTANQQISFFYIDNLSIPRIVFFILTINIYIIGTKDKAFAQISGLSLSKMP